MFLDQLTGNKKLTATEKQIIQFMKSFPRIVINSSLEELSSECFVSQASIIRLCKKLGTKGFADFKVKLASELSSFALDGQDISVDLPIGPNDTMEDIAATFFKLTIQTLEHEFQTVDLEHIGKAARLLAGADLVHLYGRGESLILASDFHYKLIRLGIHSSLETLNGFQEAISRDSSSNTNEIALIISQYLDSHQVHYIIDELVSNNIPFILLTASQKTWPYDRLAKVTLRIKSTESRHKMGSFNSRTAMMYVLDCLYGQLFALDYERNAANLARFSERKIERDYYYNAQKEPPV